MNIPVTYPPDPDRGVLLEQIATTARHVRILQREFFKSRTKDILIASKGAERELDLLLADLAQPTLWPDPEPTNLITGGNP